MKKAVFIFISILVSVAGRAEELTDACEATIKSDILKEGSAMMGGEIAEDQVDFSIYLNSKKDKLIASFTRKNDGLYLYFESAVTEQEIQTCKIQPKINRENSCRYSSYGDNYFDEIENVFIVENESIKNDKNLTPIQKDQIIAFLPNESGTATLNEQIQGTDDEEVNYSTVTLPDGQVLDYYKAYGGDNPYGVFYFTGTLGVAGSNGDGDICINFAK